MIKLFKSMSIRLVFYITLTLLGVWLYLDLQPPTWYNTIFCVVFVLCLLSCFVVDAKMALHRFLSTPNK